jgi:hypothetical protein
VGKKQQRNEERYSYLKQSGRKGMSTSEEQWNESKAILLLQRAGKLIGGLRLQGCGCPKAPASYTMRGWSQRMMLGI